MGVPVFPAALRLIAAAAILLLPSIAAAATIAFRIDRFSADPAAPTFGGRGLIEFDGGASDPADIDLLSLRISTPGTIIPDETTGVAIPVTHVFLFDEGDILSVSGLALAGSGLTGSIAFDRSVSEGGGIIAMDFFMLDFDAGIASGFCSYRTDLLAECVEDGGSSTGVEAALSVVPIPLPATLPLLIPAVGGLGAAARHGRRSRT